MKKIILICSTLLFPVLLFALLVSVAVHGFMQGFREGRAERRQTVDVQARPLWNPSR